MCRAMNRGATLRVPGMADENTSISNEYVGNDSKNEYML